MIAHFDAVSGVSGDMILGALVDAGADLGIIRKQIELIEMPPVNIRAREVHKRGIRATKIDVEGPAAGAQVFNNYAEAEKLIDGAGLDPSVTAGAKEVILNLCRAEAAVHGSNVEDVHVHEVGAGDTIVDVVGALIGLQLLGIDSVTCSPVTTGTGVLESSHGPLPIPPPAVVELLIGVPIRHSEVKAELTTPTGAALIAHLAKQFGGIASMVVAGRGYGAGSRDLEIANVLRVTIGQPAEQNPAAVEQLQMEANIDDMNPELYEYVLERLFAAGALDAWITPAIGKRGRPLSLLQVLAEADDEKSIRSVLVAETSTIGVRTLPVSRWMAEREWLEISIKGQPVRLKIARAGGRIVNVAPEYSDCVEVARRTGLALKRVYQMAVAAAPET